MCSEIAAQQSKVDVGKAIVNKRWKLIALNGKTDTRYILCSLFDTT